VKLNKNTDEVMRFTKIFITILLLSLSIQSCNSQNDLTDNKINTESEQTVTTNTETKQEIEEINDEITEHRQNAITRTVKMAEDAIVGINVTEVREVVVQDPLMSPFFRFFFGQRKRLYQVEGLGSGFLISPDGYILTNHHVAGNAKKIVVTMTDGSKHDAKIVGADRTSDIALLKIDGENLPYLKFGNSDDVLLGEWVIAFGNPFGLFDLNAKPTVTVGVISNNKIDLFQDGRVYKGLIQTDAAISSGNSGGPLLNAAGEVIGMNTMIFSTAQNQKGAGSIGIGWAIPINRIKKIVALLKKNKKLNRDFDIGMEVTTMTPEVARYIGAELHKGVVITAINTKNPAAKAGLEPGDIIIEIDGNKISDEFDFYLNMQDKFVGDFVKIVFIRDGEKKTVKYKLRQRGLRRG
jgi:serine protease Do